jgi:hypothetical protein
MVAETTLFKLKDQDAEILRAVGNYYTTQGLNYGWKSNTTKGYDQGHWNRTILTSSKTLPFDQAQMPLMKTHPELMHLWNIVQAVIGERALTRVYINGYTYGTDGYSHIDDHWIRERFGEDAASETVIMYLNDEWHRDWAGETVIFNDSDDIEAAVMPKPGRVLIFDSSKQHAARSVSRVCPVLRKVLVFKTMDLNAVSEEVRFVLDLTKDVQHSGRSFFEHLYATAMIIEQHQGSQDLIKAALYHSIYGTAYFKHDNIPTREEVRELIGERAEELAFKFCQLEDRTNVLISGQLPEDYSSDDHLDLVRIEMANLIEQNFDGKYNDQLNELQKVLAGNGD